MRLLLDTHALLWWLDGDPKLSPAARTAMSNEAHPVWVSAATAWEIATKVRIGKLPEAGEVAARLPDILAEQVFSPLAISIEHARRAGLLQHRHRDPFDRMLIAQALIEGMTLVSNETLFDSFQVQRLW